MPKISPGQNRPKIIVIIGPTASGKSDLGIKIAQKFNGEIISADSRQVYREMDIGTGKVLRDKTLPVPKSKIKNQNSKLKRDYYSEGIRHHLIDIASPKKQFAASDFKKLGEKAIAEISSRNKIPIIVGGTGFYIDILLGRMNSAEVPPNPKLRKKLEKLKIEKLFEKLQKLDPDRAKTIDRLNKRRLIRALEIFFATEKSSFSNYKLPLAGQAITNYNSLWLGINPGKEKLAKKIKNRLDSRLKEGMIGEVIRLHEQGVSWKRLDDFGLEYRWISRWLIQNQNAKIKNQNDNAKLKNFKSSEFYDRLLREIIKYSKRQMTWFKRNKEINWHEGIKNKKEVKRLISDFLS